MAILASVKCKGYNYIYFLLSHQTSITILSIGFSVYLYKIFHQDVESVFMVILFELVPSEVPRLVHISISKFFAMDLFWL